MGDVYLAADQKLKRQVALKVLPSEMSRDPSCGAGMGACSWTATARVTAKKAGRLLEEALAAYRQLGMPLYAEIVESLLKEASR